MTLKFTAHGKKRLLWFRNHVASGTPLGRALKRFPIPLTQGMIISRVEELMPETNHRGSNWILLGKLPYSVTLERKDDGVIVAGDSLYAIVRDNLIISLVLRFEAQPLPSNCDYIWREEVYNE